MTFAKFDPAQGGNTVQRGRPIMSGILGGSSLALPYFTAHDQMAIHQLRGADSAPVRNQFMETPPPQAAKGAIRQQVKSNMDGGGARDLGNEAPAYSWAKNVPRGPKHIHLGHYAHPGDDFSDTKFNPPTTFGVDEKTGLQAYTSRYTKMDTSAPPHVAIHEVNPKVALPHDIIYAAHKKNGGNVDRAGTELGPLYKFDLKNLGRNSYNLPPAQFMYKHEFEKLRQDNPGLHASLPKSGNLTMMSYEEGKPGYLQAL